MTSSRELPPFDKYDLYHRAVQCPEADVDFLHRAFRSEAGKAPLHLREDFCGTFANCCEWVRRYSGATAVGVDLDPEPLEYGRQHHLPTLSDAQRERVRIVEGNVLAPDLPAADVVCALNFSYSGFKDRATLGRYFRQVYESLAQPGVLVLDVFGGSECMEPNEEETDHGDFVYFWDQDTYDPISGEARFFIHFQRPGEPKRERVFRYDWRLWSIPELRDLLAEAGFAKTTVYWEGTDEDGDGNGEFEPCSEGEPCETYLAYLVAAK